MDLTLYIAQRYSVIVSNFLYLEDYQSIVPH